MKINFQHVADEMQGKDIKERIESMHEKLTMYLISTGLKFSVSMPYFLDWSFSAKDRDQYRYNVYIEKNGRIGPTLKELIENINNIKSPVYTIK